MNMTDNALNIEDVATSGTFTPTLSFSGSEIKYALSFGSWYKEGAIVYVYIFIKLLSKGVDGGAGATIFAPGTPGGIGLINLTISFLSFVTSINGVPRATGGAFDLCKSVADTYPKGIRWSECANNSVFTLAGTYTTT